MTTQTVTATAIDPAIEELISLTVACRLVPPTGISMATMFRWISPRGVRGARLATVVIGGRRLTSRESLSRFFAAQNATESPAPSFTPSQRQKQAEVANRLLAEALS